MRIAIKKLSIESMDSLWLIHSMPMLLDRQVNNQVPVAEDLPLAKTAVKRRAFLGNSLHFHS